MALYEQALIRIFPNLTSVYVGLLTAVPDVAGSGLVEAYWVDYNRISHSAWAVHQDGVTGAWYLSNTGTIVFNPLKGASQTIHGWAVWDALVAGNLLAASVALESHYIEYSPFVTVGTQVRFLDDTLRIYGG
jgi:hypothetical protein